MKQVSGWVVSSGRRRLMMIGKNHHLADSATLNKHRKVLSEARTRELPSLANYKLLYQHYLLP